MSSIYQMKPEFSVRIVVCDHYLTKPVSGIDVVYSEFRGADIKQVPVLRIFGSAPDGRKTCLHVHGVFPYFYVPCPTPNPEPQFLYQIAASLDKALNIALKQANSINQHVYKITLVKGLPFYGFHDKDHLYLKVFLYNPNLIKQAVELCSNGAILGQTFQPHESHLNFTLQFFIDFNLFGMSNIDLQSLKFRRSGLSQSSNEPIQNYNDFNLKPESICYYEADCSAIHIINRQRVGRGDGIENPGLEEVWKQENERRKKLNMSITSKSLSQGRIKSQETESHYKYEKMCAIKLSNLEEKHVDINVDKNLEEVHYPAESVEGSQLFKAVDLTVHVPNNALNVCYNETLKRNVDETFIDIVENTIVDENVALNSSLPFCYSQVTLDNEDLELVDLLQDMDERIVEEDSIMKTPAEADKSDDVESDDEEYSQVFNEETILMETHEGDDNETSPVWNDSFWDGVHIPQLDGTCDDDHIKKVRKRKMRSFKLGLSRPKNKKSDKNIDSKEDSESKADVSELDEIDVSMETIDNISSSHIKSSNVLKSQNSLDNKSNFNEIPSDNQSISDLVGKITIKLENTHSGIAQTYDLQNHYEAVAGPSNVTTIIKKTDEISDHSISDSYESSLSSEDTKGITSFYDRSKIFNVSMENNVINNSNLLITDKIIKQENSSNINCKRDVMGRKDLIVVTPKIRAPTNKHINSCLEKYNIKKIKNIEPYFSNHKDVGEKVEIGHMVLKLRSKLAKDQKPFEKVIDTTSIEEWRQLLFLQNNEISEEVSKAETLKLLLSGNRKCTLEPIKKPPTKCEIIKWLNEKQNKILLKEENVISQKERNKNLDDLDNSQAIGLNEDAINNSISPESDDKEKTVLDNSLQVTMQADGSYLCFGSSDNQNNTVVESALVEVNFLTVMIVEVHTSVRGDLNPDPLRDAIQAVFLTITNDCPPDHFLSKTLTEVLVVDDHPTPKLFDRCIFNTRITYVKNEEEIIEKTIELIKTHDPDIMCGYEIELNSWGYLFERSEVLGIEIVKEVSRITEKHRQKRWKNEENDFEGRIIGRIIFGVWRLFRHELALSSYSFENCMFEILKERVPCYTYAQLSTWWNEESRILKWIPMEYYLTRLSGTVRMLEKLDIISRTAELARLFGLQWWEVLSRGSQFRVESLMIRAARPLNLVALSPTVRQRAVMRAPECLPLILEPESRFYSDPVIVLDFQSLYPSMMIAYNYCFSTCIGRVQNINGNVAYEFGAWRLRIPKSKLETLAKNDLIHWSPVGVGFVKPSVRRGVLPALLRRILAARQAVKKSMKLQTDESIKKAMHSRQLGLKLIANVTYGYTAANFSGRMPCVEVGDSVVAKGRETLERAIKLVRDNKQWNAKVVYGDTDSMFVLVPGETRERAFEIGQQIADAVTADNPSPVALKLEKVYQPCILQTKKRYVGYMYESPDQKEPIYEAKGIETVRRDGCPAGVKMLKRALCELFDTGDMSRVKRVTQAWLARLADGSLPVHELFFTREYHGPAGYRPGAAAPPNEIAKRLRARDCRSAPRRGWRVSWAVVSGAPGAALWRLARAPRELAGPAGGAGRAGGGGRAPPHRLYYAARVLLPPLHRCLSLLGVDVYKWWTELGYTREIQHENMSGGGIARYLWRERCAVCGARGARAVCALCAAAGPRAAAASAAALHARLAAAQAPLLYCDQICNSCCGHSQSRQCENVECPVFWRRLTAQDKLDQVRDVFAHLPSQFTKESLDF